MLFKSKHMFPAFIVSYVCSSLQPFLLTFLWCFSWMWLLQFQLPFVGSWHILANGLHTTFSHISNRSNSKRLISMRPSFPICITDDHWAFRSSNSPPRITNFNPNPTSSLNYLRTDCCCTNAVNSRLLWSFISLWNWLIKYQCYIRFAYIAWITSLCLFLCIQLK